MQEEKLFAHKGNASYGFILLQAAYSISPKSQAVSFTYPEERLLLNLLSIFLSRSQPPLRIPPQQLSTETKQLFRIQFHLRFIFR